MQKYSGDLKKVLEQFGIEPNRLRIEWVSAAEGDRFAGVMRDMVDEIRRLGPSPLRNGGIDLGS
jgi:F420-non-reducing hydrogenase iron-sulfur subunit